MRANLVAVNQRILRMPGQRMHAAGIAFLAAEN